MFGSARTALPRVASICTALVSRPKVHIATSPPAQKIPLSRAYSRNIAKRTPKRTQDSYRVGVGREEGREEEKKEEDLGYP